MAREIVPVKIIMDVNADGSLRDGVFQYQMKEEDGSINKRKFYTIGIAEALDNGEKITLKPLIKKIFTHGEKAEKIKVK